MLALGAACAPGAPAARGPEGAAGPTPAVAPPAPTAEAAAPPLALEVLRLGMVGSATDAGFFIGLERGYFREQGLDLEATPFDSAARMVAPLAAGQLDVGGGTHSAGLFNAVARGIAIKMVADKGSALPGHGFTGLLFRRDLVEAGRLRNPGDLRGARFAASARGGAADLPLAVWLRPYGLTVDDVEWVELGFPEHASAFAGRTVDASVTIEPFVTRILDMGLATQYQRIDEAIPGYQVAEVFFSAQFAGEQAEVGRRFMVGYLRGVRYYNDAFDGGDAAKRQEVIDILTRYTAIKDAAVYARITLPGLDPDGRMNLATLAEDQALWLATGLQQARINLSDVVDSSFAEAAVRTLGPYR
jgi:NitT/TauT family transport system substrate-binding protein